MRRRTTTAENHEHNIYLDGDKIAHVVTKRQAVMMQYPNAIGAHDSYGSHLTAGATAMPA